MFLRILDRLEEILIASLIAAATLLIFVAVVQRYAVGIPFLYPHRLSHQPDLGAGAVHLHVRVDGEVRRRLRRAHRHPRRRRRRCQHAAARRRATRSSCSACCAARCSPSSSARMGAKFVDRALRATDQVSPDMELPRWIVYPVRAARLLSDVLPLPAGRLGVLAHRRTAAP